MARKLSTVQNIGGFLADVANVADEYEDLTKMAVVLAPLGGS